MTTIELFMLLLVLLSAFLLLFAFVDVDVHVLVSPAQTGQLLLELVYRLVQYTRILPWRRPSWWWMPFLGIRIDHNLLGGRNCQKG